MNNYTVTINLRGLEIVRTVEASGFADAISKTLNELVQSGVRDFYLFKMKIHVKQN